MRNAHKTSQSFERYECWRPAYEVWALLGWTFGFGWVTYLYFTDRLPLAWCLVLWGLCLLFLIRRAFEALKVLCARAALSGSQVSFMTFKELAYIMKGHNHDLWLGYGFRWWPEHSQRLYELMKLDWTTLQLPRWLTRLLLGKTVLPDEAAGLPIIHVVSDNDESLFRPLKNFEGGLCLCGTTQAGKGVYLSHLVAQAIARGDVVIVIDPKHSSRLKDNILHACRACGRDDPLTFHPAFPDTGIRLDPIHSFTNATEIASRIRQAFPPNMDESFANFAWMAVNAIAQGLIALEIRPTLPLIAKYVKLGIYDLLEPLLEKHAKEHAGSDWQKRYWELKEKAGRPPLPSISERLMVLVALYETELHYPAPDPAIDGLIEVFRHNREHYSKITASLLPILSAPAQSAAQSQGASLTSGNIALGNTSWGNVSTNNVSGNKSDRSMEYTDSGITQTTSAYGSVTRSGTAAVTGMTMTPVFMGVSTAMSMGESGCASATQTPSRRFAPIQRKPLTKPWRALPDF